HVVEFDSVARDAADRSVADGDVGQPGGGLDAGGGAADGEAVQIQRHVAGHDEDAGGTHDAADVAGQVVRAGVQDDVLEAVALGRVGGGDRGAGFDLGEGLVGGGDRAGGRSEGAGERCGEGEAGDGHGDDGG